MKNISSMQKDLVFKQITPHLPLPQWLKDGFEEVNRLEFLPKLEASKAYLDVPFSIDNYVVYPVRILAFLLNALNIQENTNLLIIGAGFGYSAAIASKKAKHVTAFQPNSRLFTKLLESTRNYSHIEVVSSLFLDRKFDSILVMGGSLISLPSQWADLLEDNGKLATVMCIHNNVNKDIAPLCQGILFRKDANESSPFIKDKVLFDTFIPLSDFQKNEKHFHF